MSRLRSGLEWPWEGRTVTVWCKGFLKAHAALWKPAVRWALSAGGVKAGFVVCVCIGYTHSYERSPYTYCVCVYSVILISGSQAAGQSLGLCTGRKDGDPAYPTPTGSPKIFGTAPPRCACDRPPSTLRTHLCSHPPAVATGTAINCLWSVDRFDYPSTNHCQVLKPGVPVHLHHQSRSL